MRLQSATVTPLFDLSAAARAVGRRGKAALAALSVAALAACASGPSGQTAAGSSGGSQASASAQSAAVDPNAPVTVALLAPTSAASDGVRRAAQDLVAAAQIARTERAQANLSLKIYDTRGEPSGAATAAEAAVRDGAAIILGPLLASSAEAAAPVAERAGINVISFSNNGSVAGGNLWVLGQTPGDEMRRIFAHAASRGASAIAVAYPQNRYGQRVADEANAAARDAGVGIVALASYPYDPVRGRGNFDQISQAGGDIAAQIIGSGADAVLLADVGNDLASLGSFLNYFDVSPRTYRYLGLSRWGTRATLREPSLNGGLFSAVDPAAKAAFERSFSAQMSRRPSTVASVGYDAVAAVSDMLANARRSGGSPFDARAITASSHSGATGDFVLLPDGTNRRGLAVLQVAGDGFRIVEPAPRVGPGL